jgi:hypothetical protein
MLIKLDNDLFFLFYPFGNNQIICLDRPRDNWLN